MYCKQQKIAANYWACQAPYFGLTIPQLVVSDIRLWVLTCFVSVLPERIVDLRDNCFYVDIKASDGWRSMRDPSFRCSPSHPWKLPQSRHYSVSSSQPTSRTVSHPQFDPSSYFLLFLVSLICSSTEYTSSEGPPLPSCISARLFPYAWERRGPSIQWSSGYQYLLIGGNIWAGALLYKVVT